MSKLPKFSLTKDTKRNDWKLVDDQTDMVKKRFDTKAEATQGGMLKKALGPTGGSVRIKKENGRIQEERTFPRKEDPKSSPG